MAIVFAYLDAMPPFQENLEMVAAPLSRQSTCKEDLISNTKKGIEAGISRAEEQRQLALEAYESAKETLRQEEERVAEINRNRDPDSDAEPATVSEYYYDRVSETEQEYDYADMRVTRAYRTQADYNRYCDNYREKQRNAVEQYSQLLKKSQIFFESYIDVLIRAKEAISKGAGTNNGCETVDIAPFGTADVNTRPLTEEEATGLSNKTGWSIQTINQKCTISADGTIHYKTVNADYEGMLHPSGVYFERSTVNISGVEVEGVFPRFNAIFEPTIMPESLWNSPGSKYTDQFSYCNVQLKQAVQINPALAAQFSPIQLKQIMAGSTPAGFTWHHHQEPGRMQLVRKQQHNPPMGGASHTGGGALWCR